MKLNFKREGLKRRKGQGLMKAQRRERGAATGEGGIKKKSFTTNSEKEWQRS